MQGKDIINDSARFKALRGRVFTYKADPFFTEAPEQSYDYFDDGLVVIGADGKIAAVGDYGDMERRFSNLDVTDYGRRSLIMPGFVDCHVHYVQSPMIGSCGDTLLDWLNRYTFPTEARMVSKDFADEVASVFFDEILSKGTTTANVFATTFAQSVDAFFEESERRGTLMISGKVLQDRNLPDNLRDRSAAESVELSEELLEKWHRRGRQLYAVIPRFAPTSTPEQLKLAGELYQRHIDSGVYLHTHLNESVDEIEWVKELFPDAATYTDVYRRYGMIDRRTVLAHCCVMKPAEWQMLHDAGAAAVHCPASNFFLGDGHFRFWEAKDGKRPVATGVGTDVGGGTSFSVGTQLGEAYKTGMLQGHPLGAVQAFYLATLGGARALGLDDRIGSLAPGRDADIAVLDLDATPFLSWRLGQAPSLASRLFVLQTLMPDNIVEATYVGGRLAYSRR